MLERAALEDVIRFHGHYCPGVMIGYRAALGALDLLGVERAQDEELVAICETEACGLDAVQVLTGCTMGKGNLILRDWGKQVFSFGRRADGRFLRLALRFGATDDPALADLPEAERRRLTAARMETMPLEELFDVRWIEAPLPEPARIFRSVRCAVCGEGVMEARARLRDGQPICPACAGPEYTRLA